MNETREFLPAPKSVAEAMAIANTLARSGMVPDHFQRKPEAIFVAMMWSHTLGIPVVQGLQYIAVINGKPSMYGDGLLAVVRASGKLEDIKEELTEYEADGQKKLLATCTVYRRGMKSPVVSNFSQEDAEIAGVWTKKGPWTAYPKRMLKLRARSFALRDAFTDVLAGMASAEEQADIVDVEPVEKEAQKPAAKPKMPRKKAAPAAIENNPTPSASEVVPQQIVEEAETETEPKPAPVAQEEAPAPVEAMLAEPEIDPAEAADLAAAEDWMAAADQCASIAGLNDLYTQIPIAVLDAHPEITPHFTLCKNRLNGEA